MTAAQTDGANAFDRSREHRRGVRQACIELEESLARPAGQDMAKWSSQTAACCHRLTEAFQHHAEQSEGPDGLLPEILEIAPRLAHAVEQVKHEHEVILAEIARLEAAITDRDYAGTVAKVRGDVLRILQDLAAHRQRGADLIYEAYSVDVEGGESG